MKYLILVMIFSNSLWSQNLDKHKWKERVVLISADKENYELAEQQFDILIKDKEGLIDRNIVLYKCLEEKCTFYNWKDKSNAYISTKTKTSKGFNIELVGLDGGKKYYSNTIVKIDEIFSRIDSMPMRRQEIESRKKND